MYESPFSVSFMEEIAEEVAKEVGEWIDDSTMKATVDAKITVDKDELVKALAYDRGQYDKGYADGKRDAWEWISVEERMPEVNVSVLAIAKFKECGGYRIEISSWSGAINHGVPHFWEFGDAMEVTHWMPLPEPPKEEK